MSYSIGYRQYGDAGGPMNINEGYRWNVPVVTYGFDQELVDYFGERGVEGRIYNLGGGSRISLQDVLQILGQVTGIPPEVRYAEKQKGDMRHTFASTERAAQDLGYNPAVKLQEGLAQEYQWIKNLHEKGLTFKMA